MIDLPGQKRRFQTPGILLVILGFSGLFWLVVSWNYSGQFWKEWYPLLISSDKCSSEIEQYLDNITGGEVVSESNSFIRYNGFSAQEEITVADLRSGERFFSSDPRLDPWMKGSIAYFNQGIYRIFYLPRTYSPLRYFWVFSRSEVMKQAEWKLPDAEISYPVIIIYLCLLFLLGWKSIRFFLTGGAFLLAGVHCVLTGQSTVLLILAVTALFVRLLLTGFEKNLWVWIFTFLTPGMALYGSLFDLRTAGFLLPLAAVGTGAFLLIPVKRKIQGRRGQDHRLFEPVPLIPRTETGSSTGRASVSPAVFGAVLLTLLLGVFNFPGIRILPADLPSAETSGGVWSAGGMNPAGARSLLPDAEDYLRHRAYQEGFMFGAAYEMPLEGGGVDLENYDLEDGRVTGKNFRVLGYTESWFEEKLTEMVESGPSRLLRSEAAPPVVRTLSSFEYGIPLQMLLAFAANIVIYVLIHMSGQHPARSRAVRSYGKQFFVLRRKQQAA